MKKVFTKFLTLCLLLTVGMTAWAGNANVAFSDNPPETVAITISAAKRGTFVSEYPLDFTGLDIFAMACTGYQEGVTEWGTQIKGSAVMTEKLMHVAAGEGIYVGADNITEATTFNVPVYKGDDFDEIPGINAFVGNLTDHAITIYQKPEKNYINYILQKHEGDTKPKFYKVLKEAEGGNTVGSHRAYLKVYSPSWGGITAAKEVLDIVEGGDATAIADVAKSQELRTESYNLSGVRVGADYKGIVIVNGRKVYNK